MYEAEDKKTFQSVISEASHMQTFYSRIQYRNSYVQPALTQNLKPLRESKHLKVGSWVFDLETVANLWMETWDFFFFFLTII